MFFNTEGENQIFAGAFATFFLAMLDHGYGGSLLPIPDLYVDDTGATDNDPKTATAANFINEGCGAGILMVTSHGVVNQAGQGIGIIVESYKDNANAQAAINAYVAANTFAAGELAITTSNSIYITPAAIKNHCGNKLTSFIYLFGCSTASLADSFKYRDFFGYGAIVTCGIAAGDVSLLWHRMHGVVDSGTKRPADLAYGDGTGFHPSLVYKHTAGTPVTILSPAVVQHTPDHGATYSVPTTVNATVEFDAPMDTSDPSALLSVSLGTCNAEIHNPVWRTPFQLDFVLELNAPGVTELRVDGTAAKGDTIGKALDGNVNGRDVPVGTDHVGPNRDDHSWTISCTVCVDADGEGADGVDNDADGYVDEGCDSVGGIVGFAAPEAAPPAQRPAPSDRDYASPVAAAVAGGAALAAAGWYVRSRRAR